MRRTILNPDVPLSPRERVLAELPSIFRWVVRRQVPPQDTRDICHDVIRIALEKLESTDEAGIDVRAWLWGIAKNVVAQYRHRGRRSDSTEGNEDELSQAPYPVSTAETRMESREILYMLLEKVHPSRREIFLAHWVDGLTFDELSQAFNLSPEAARKRTERAMHEFVAAWEEYQGAQRKRGLLVLPIAAFALLEAERLYCSNMAAGAIDALRAAIEPLLRGDDAPMSQTIPSPHHGAEDAAEALAANPSPIAPWLGSFSALVVVGAIFLAISLLPKDTSDPTPITPETVALALPEPEPDAIPIPSANGSTPADGSTTPANQSAPSVLAHAAKTYASPSIEPMPYVLLLVAQRAVDRGDLRRACASLAAYDARYPRNPLPVARGRLARRIADLSAHSRPAG